MIKPATPVDEFRRLETLRNLKLLDTPPEERFDRVTRLARRIFGTPIALVSLIDADRQWFKSRQGLEATETPREISFCGHAILDDRIMVINDTHADERFCDNPLVTCDPNIRFYAGYPISAPDGSKMGTLCIIDREPRQLSRDDLSMLRELGRMIEEELIAANMTCSDPATGLSNRVGFSMIAEHLLAYCERDDTSTSLLAFHVNNLSKIDEDHGRDEGDRAAMEFSHMLLASFRDSDIVGRIAQDVFVVLLAGAKLSDAQSSQQRLQTALNERNLDPDCACEMEISVTTVAYDSEHHSGPESLICEAENELQKARTDNATANAG